jgi:hypothetical protein
MMKRLSFLFLPALAVSLIASSCGSDSNEQTSASDTSAAAPAAVSGPVATLQAANDAQEFPDARLGLGGVTATASGDSVKLSFSFNVKNYELKSQTGDSNSKVCNNSAQGQHIHFILDNKPYVALYEPKHETTVAKNSEHYVMAFLSRSYHLSLKNNGAALLYRFKIDENGKLQKLDDPKTPMVFYSRPKGDYLGKDTENVLLDFYVWNASLGNEYTVKADVQTGGRDTTFIISDWKPYFLKNLAMGKTSIKLLLLDKDGRKVEGPHTEVTREINLAKDEPMN